MGGYLEASNLWRSSGTLSYTSEEGLDGKRLDLAIVAADRGLSRRKARRIIDLGGHI